MPVTPKIGVGLFSYQFGGSERIGVDLALEFKVRGYQVICFAFHDSDGPLRSELENAGIRCVDMNYRKANNLLPRRLSYLWRFWRMLRKERIAALHVHHHGALILCGIPALLAGVKKVVMTEHGLQALMERPDARKLTVRYSHFATDITVVEPGQAEYFERVLGLPASKIHCIANGVRIRSRSASVAAHMRQLLGIPTDAFAFLYVGRLNQVKDLGTLLEAFSMLPTEMLARARLYLIGDGPERQLLESKRDALESRDKVVFLGARNDVADLLMAADAFVMSSRSEGLPMVLLEAMAAEVPCIATAVGGIPGLFGSDRGLAVPPHDPIELSSAMASITRSAHLRKGLAARALDNIRQHYSLDAIVDRYLELLGLPRWAEGAPDVRS